MSSIRSNGNNKGSTGSTSLDNERLLAKLHKIRFVGAADEVGRGALAGPITVGFTVIDIENVSEFPELRDSKLLTPARREELVTQVRQWAVGYGVGHASAEEVDQLGVTSALRLAGTRAVSQCRVPPQAVLLDGSYDWLSAPEQDLFDLLANDREPIGLNVPVKTIIKGDMICQSIAGASILAKVERDGIMVELSEAYPEFGWNVNKGYATASHRDAITKQGPSDFHRKTWNLTSTPEEDKGKATGTKAK
ncbi:ribonuclease HII [Glutamicibacter sp.]|uniref:ribonuclease HII n=1 Tax=Glutamicibacter sp. TaxID=1931995 RepID=UPI0028BF1A6C|nr:ribonuclease HII [Glutamicibacter sp.]